MSNDDRCKRCGGNNFPEREDDGLYIVSLQCGDRNLKEKPEPLKFLTHCRQEGHVVGGYKKDSRKEV